ncbi:hypothetical protein [Pseudoalteromonas sp. C12FD-1]|jgi:ABC-type antimicrobial peptide transport system ATPase subunit|uniref:hypothetical protein n=1 Tax=Pseudoalteromonas sp. C12FD-1 TaxID=3131979 RepID=UPI00307DB52B
MTQSFDFNIALAELLSGKGLVGYSGVLKKLIKQIIKAAFKQKWSNCRISPRG